MANVNQKERDVSFSQIDFNTAFEDYNLVQTSPENNDVFESSTSSVKVEWTCGGSTSPLPVGYSFEVEYSINGNASTILGTTEYSYTINSLSAASEVKWRILCIDDLSVILTSSSWHSFYVLRGTPIYVKEGGVGNGSSWSNAIDLQGALTEAVFGDELWVSEGTYMPAQSSDRTISFQVKEGVKIYGGFLGTETSLTQRSWNDNKTILSGDIGVVGNNSDNSYNVVWMAGTSDSPITSNTILDGLIIENGYADFASQNRDRGAGLQLIYASPSIVNVWFRDNYSVNYGGAIHGNGYSEPKFYNSIFSNNKALKYGGAVLANARMDFINCLFFANEATDRGGAINGPEVPNNVYVYNSIIWNNDASSYPQLYNAIVGYSIVDGGYTGIWTISDDPQMVDPESNDFRINSRSSALNTGSNSYLPAWLTLDYDKNTRIEGASVDIGIFEGYTETPFPISPENNQLFDATVTSANLVWEWDASVPADITGYAVDYYVNDQYMDRIEGIGGLSWTIAGLKSIDRIRWRVAGVNAAGEYIWSPWSVFSIKRDHTLFVKTNATGSGNSWTDATNLQDALDRSVWGDEIWVASGVYKPTNTSAQDISFELKDGIKVYGGFSGTEGSVDERDIMRNYTILSGDIGVEGAFDDNTYHVVKIDAISEPVTNETVLNGVIIENGNAAINAGNNNNGGGLYLINASPMVINVWFRNNQSLYQGGAVYGDGLSSPNFANAIFSDNKSGQNGGAVYSNASMKFYNCLWYSNYSAYWGGAAYASTNYTTLVYNSISWGNEALQNYSDFRYLLVKSSLVQDGSGVSSLTGDPLFADADADNFMLPKESPAYNSGNNLYVYDWFLTDFGGDQRIISGIVNMGPFEMEFIPNSSSTITDDAEGLVIWPNPVKAGQSITVMVGSEGISSMLITDVSGKTIMKEYDLGEETIVIKPVDYNPGVYIVIVECINGTRVLGKLVIK